MITNGTATTSGSNGVFSVSSSGGYSREEMMSVPYSTQTQPFSIPPPLETSTSSLSLVSPEVIETAERIEGFRAMEEDGST